MKRQSAANPWVRGAGAVGGDLATVSRCSCRHAADPSLTKENGESKAEKDDEKREAVQHMS